MKIPRNVTGARLADVLCRRWQYTRVHQVCSHIVLETSAPAHQRIAVPDIIGSASARSLQSYVLFDGGVSGR